MVICQPSSALVHLQVAQDSSFKSFSSSSFSSCSSSTQPHNYHYYYYHRYCCYYYHYYSQNLHNLFTPIPISLPFQTLQSLNRSTSWLSYSFILLVLLTLSSSIPSVHALTTTRSLHYPPPQLPHLNHDIVLLHRRQAPLNTSSFPDNATCIPSKHLSRGTSFDIQALLIPVLVLLSGMFAGLTLGYMSLDSTQLCVLAKSGTPQQQRLAKKIAPLRKDGHLLLITLLIANMVANETLPVVSDNVLGGGIQAVIVSTVLVIIFSEIIPQSVCSTYGLQIGAACAKPVQILVYILYPICWPIAWLLTKILGAHSGIIYRRAELKELVNLHASQQQHGGDLNQDVVTIVGAAIDLQESVVRDAMTKLDMCFMLDIETKLDYETLGRVLASGHSRIPVFEVVVDHDNGGIERRKILGALLTKQLILIDPEDGVPLREFPLNPLPVVADNMPLLNILNSFQEGRSHLAIVCPRRQHQPKVAFAPLPQVLDIDSAKEEDVQFTIPSEKRKERSGWLRFLFRCCKSSFSHSGESHDHANPSHDSSFARIKKTDDKKSDGHIPSHTNGDRQQFYSQSSANNNISSFWSIATDQTPMGIITLEDVLEKLLGEQIYDETDTNERGNMAVHPYVPPEAVEAMRKSSSRSLEQDAAVTIVLASNEKGLIGDNKSLQTGNGNTNKRWSFNTLRSPSMGGRSRTAQQQQQQADAQPGATILASRMTGGPNPCESVTSDNDHHVQGPYGVLRTSSVDQQKQPSLPTNLVVSSTEQLLTTAFEPPTTRLDIVQPTGQIQIAAAAPIVNAVLDIRPAPVSPMLSDALNIERGRRRDKLLRAGSGTNLGGFSKQTGVGTGNERNMMVPLSSSSSFKGPATSLMKSKMGIAITAISRETSLTRREASIQEPEDKKNGVGSGQDDEEEDETSLVLDKKC